MIRKEKLEEEVKRTVIDEITSKFHDYSCNLESCDFVPFAAIEHLKYVIDRIFSGKVDSAGHSNLIISDSYDYLYVKGIVPVFNEESRGYHFVEGLVRSKNLEILETVRIYSIFLEELWKDSGNRFL